ncbi:hypothetical protein JCM8097_003826 [Rhodosporidiobolus ruineniae]
MRRRYAALSAAVIAALVLLGHPTATAAQGTAPAGGSGTTTTSSTTKSCGWDYSCPKTSPCCTEYGYCSAGVGCLGGCNPHWSYGDGYCAPLASCANANYTFADDSRIQSNHTAWDGDSTKYDFTLDKLDTANNSIVQNGELVLSLTEDGGGTRVSTTRNMLYGTISAYMKTVGTAGVVTAFITMSGVKDEIDIEWTGGETDEVQTNYFWEGVVPDWTENHGGTHTAKNRDTTYHTYTMNWTPTQLQWLVDNKVVRTLLKSNTTGGNQYPQTPSRVQFSVWPAGIAGTSNGTIEWAGGMIDWSSKEYTSQGYFSANVKWLSIQCYDGSDLDLPYQASNSSSSSNSTSSRLVKREEFPKLWERADETVSSYVWGSNDTNGQIGVFGSNAATIINSPYSTGQNMIVKNGDTKGVSKSGSSSGSTGIFGDNAVGNWWARQKTAVHVGIIVGACALALFLFVAICTICVRARDKKRQRANKAKDTIPLVGRGGAAAAGAGASTADLPGKFRRQDSDYADSIPSTKGSFRSPSAQGGGGYRTATPPVPTIPQQYSSVGGYGQGQGYGGRPLSPGGMSAYSHAPSYGQPASPYGAYPQQQPGGYGAYTPQQYGQQWPGYGNVRY